MRRVALLLLFLGCDGGADLGLEVGPGPHGPRVVFEPLALPTPDVPFPTDLSLRVTDDTASGMAWNVSPEQPSEHRSRVRRLLNTLDGYGPFAPAFVSFDDALDLTTVTEDTVMIVNIEPGSAREGERAPLDLGRGLFPSFFKVGSYWSHDPYEAYPDLLYGEANQLDLDGDGELDRTMHYDFQSNTLVLRPMMPLAQGARHAVLITRDVLGADGKPVRSPFDLKAHAAQAPEIARALELAGVAPERLAFGWTYTTADVAEPVLVMRDGVHGKGPLKRMAQIAPPGIAEVRDTGIDNDGEDDPRDHRFLLQAPYFTRILDLIAGIQGDDNYKLEFQYVDHIVFGSFHTPDMRTGEHKEFTVNTHTGSGEIGVEEVPFMLCVPKPSDVHQQPFDVMLYFHGTGTSRFEAIALCDAAARQGIAMLSFDEVGHGPLADIPALIEQNPDEALLIQRLPGIIAGLLVPDRANEIATLPFEEALEALYGVGLFAEIALHGRSEGDVNGNGQREIAEGFFFADPFRQCASILQDIVDFLHIVHTMRSLGDVPDGVDDVKSLSADELMPHLLAGDFDADGVLDAGGPDAHYSVAGTSLGGFHAAIAGAVEPDVRVTTPIVAGGGLTDIMVRSDLKFITSRLFLDVLGTVVVGCPDGEGGVHLTQGNESDRCKLEVVEDKSFGHLTDVAPGDEAVLTNQANGLVVKATVDEAGGFSVAVEADKGDVLEVRIGSQRAETESRYEGSGYVRNSSDLRRAVNTQQHVLDRCDPINFARHLFWEPLRDHPPTQVLFFNALGDDTVPVSTGVALALASGVLGKTREEWEPRLQALVEAGVPDQALYDVDDILGNNPAEMPALGATPGVETAGGVSSIRFADVNGKHEYIAGYDRKYDCEVVDGEEVCQHFQAGKHHQHQLVIYHRCGGGVIYDDDPECLQSPDCEVLESVDTLPGCMP